MSASTCEAPRLLLLSPLSDPSTAILSSRFSVSGQKRVPPRLTRLVSLRGITREQHHQRGKYVNRFLIRPATISPINPKSPTRITHLARKPATNPTRSHQRTVGRLRFTSASTNVARVTMRILFLDNTSVSLCIYASTIYTDVSKTDLLTSQVSGERLLAGRRTGKGTSPSAACAWWS